jgi:hypothetical protein
MSSKTYVIVLVVGVILGAPRLAAAQYLLELARAQAVRHPGQPVELPSPPGDYEPRTVEQLTKGAAAVVLAKLTRVRSYVGGSGDRVLTDYAVTTPTVIAGRLAPSIQPVPSQVAEPILTVYGGEVILEGVVVRCTDINRAPIQDNASYLIFLSPARRGGPSQYEIHYGGIFDISQEKLKPLLKSADYVFADFIKEPAAKVLARVQNTVQLHE